MYALMEEHIERYGLPEEYREALSNRRALHLIMLGINTVAANKTAAEKCRDLRQIIRRPVYRQALRKLDIGPMPIHWKAFFTCARWGCAWGLYMLLLVIQKIRGK